MTLEVNREGTFVLVGIGQIFYSYIFKLCPIFRYQILIDVFIISFIIVEYNDAASSVYSIRRNRPGHFPL